MLCSINVCLINLKTNQQNGIIPLLCADRVLPSLVYALCESPPFADPFPLPGISDLWTKAVVPYLWMRFWRLVGKSVGLIFKSSRDDSNERPGLKTNETFHTFHFYHI